MGTIVRLQVYKGYLKFSYFKGALIKIFPTVAHFIY